MNSTIQVAKFINIQVQMALSIERVKIAVNLISNSQYSHETPAILNLLQGTLETLCDLNSSISMPQNTNEQLPHQLTNGNTQEDNSPEIFF